MNGIALRALRLLRKPPGYVLRRLLAETRAELDRFLQPQRARLFDTRRLLRLTGSPSIGALWQRLAEQPWPLDTTLRSAAELDALCPGTSARVLERGARAVRHEVDLLGSGLSALGAQIPWHTDFKSGDHWPRGYFRDLKLIDRTRPSDVKVPWELSRVQWLLPAGQAYLLTGEERYAQAVREVLEQWIRANPVGGTVNWGIAMEPALRLFSWIWLFRVFARTASWQEPQFQGRLLCCLYQHADFVARYIERADLNGNHFTADCAGLVLAGAFFGGEQGARWLSSGWADLCREISVQVYEDGVDFEASAAYHRLVSELFALAAVFATHKGLELPADYRARLAAAARFVLAYTRRDGSSPLWGDADDARALPLGSAPLGDHRHVVSCVAHLLQDRELAAQAGAGWEEAWWLFRAAPPTAFAPELRSLAFTQGGVYILRTRTGEVFVDCGEVGLAGRGGHGHNDILSFEAHLGGQAVVSDAGCFVYTASFTERNRFRATVSHNTPQVDDQELNRFVSPELLWLLHADAHPQQVSLEERAEEVVFCGGHDGYQRLTQPVSVRRSIALSRAQPRLTVTDHFGGAGVHRLGVPLQLACDWSAQRLGAAEAHFAHVRGSRLRIDWRGSVGWQLTVTQGDIAPSYGVLRHAPRLRWELQGPVQGAWLEVSMQLLKADSSDG